MDTLTWSIAFGGGVLAFVSPCTLPLYPSFLSYITGMSVSQLQTRDSSKIHKILFLNSVLFLFGFSLVYYILGFSASFMGHLFENYRDLIRMLGGVFISVMGLFLIGIFQPQMMMREFRFPFIQAKMNKSLGSVLVGIIFAAGWTPCIGPIFGAIMYSNIINPNPVHTFVNVTAYSLGFGIPFIVMAYFIGKIKGILKYSDLLMKIGGVLLVIVGMLLYFDKVSMMNTWFSSFL
ncbi:cytochrome c biogenesis CcdA family protein [Paenibacillus apiarius]|uniref:cytochrome c biogenesis CcdA family protein n=1 Tax=Paenibacillus apiarius TaxID=46240 RepID=UPI00197FA708|nr:cytochrome c biogenesis protein CcdA [Paenibacillus apiarius]MBN3526818.1 cytochrome c biogenesis protein CcdA [Paenibacillus apiarius]